MQSDFYRALERANATLASAADPTAAAHAQIDAAAARSQAQLPWACGVGCASCCRFPVGVTIREAARLAEALRAHARSAELERTLVHEAESVRALPWAALAGRPCPLLEAGACSVYDARPLPCRALGSRDRTACERSASGEAVPVPTADDAFAAGLAVGQALDAATGSLGHRELRSALAAVLTAAPADVQRAFLDSRRVHADGIDDSAPASAAR